METLLKVEGLSKSFGGLQAVSDVNLNINKGEIRSLIGPNGAGKTTLFNLITGYLRHDAGKVTLNNSDVSGLDSAQIVRRGVGRTFQTVNIFPALPVLENVLVPLLVTHGQSWNLFGRDRGHFKDEAYQLLSSVGLKEAGNTIAGALPHGLQRRLELAMALARRPALLVLDEPTAGLAPTEIADTLELLKNLAHRQAITLFFAEHDMNVVFSISEAITVMNFGKVIADGKPEEIRANKEVQSVYLGEECP